MTMTVDRAALRATAADLLRRWCLAAEVHWYDIPGRPGLGCYGTGFNGWGVQTNQKYVAAMAVLASLGGDGADHARGRALAALRFSLASHTTGDGACTDGKPWAPSWISVLGIERMMHGVALLEADLTDADRAALRRVLTAEATWLAYSHRKGAHHGVFGDKWNDSGRNVPESNLWNGAFLWRAATMYPDHADADLWRERAHLFLANGVSVDADADDRRVVEGKPISERFRGANFFSSYALDHHGYLNVGYMAMCVSNAAMLHFDLERAGSPAPQTLHHNQAALWDVLRRMVFGDGRLARLGGDSRVRYTYCQEYLLPALLYAADHLRDGHALQLAVRQVETMRREAAFNGDGSFYGERLAWLAGQSPYYYTRLEADRANVLGMLLAYEPMVGAPPEPQVDFEADVAGGWVDVEHGAAMHRSPTRLASFAWRAHGLTQGLCLPPTDGDLAEWHHNLAGTIRFLGDTGDSRFSDGPHRRLIRHTIDVFDGGFVTCGSVVEGVDLRLAEGWQGTDAAVHHLALAALPDAHTVVVLQWCVAADRRTYTLDVRGLQLGVPNDLFNGFHRQVNGGVGERVLQSPPASDERIDLGSRWATIDGGRIGVVGVYGGESLVIDRSATRRGGQFRSLYVEELCWGTHPGTRSWEPGATLLDTGCAVLSGVDDARVRQFADDPELRRLTFADAPAVRGVSLVTLDDKRHAVLANFGEDAATVTLPSGRSVALPAGRAVVV
jgi:hypothetical protein